MIVEFGEFKRLAASMGAAARDCGNGHWQVVGAVKVNYYPTSKRRTIYVNGTRHGVHDVGPAAAIKFALWPEIHLHLGPPSRMSKSRRRALKAKLLARDPFCADCRKPLVYGAATFDHIIPQSRGGSNMADNLRLVCEPCNREKADTIVRRP